MKNILWLIVGVGVGFVVAHQYNKTQQGQAFFADLDRKTREFTAAVSDGYREREAEIRAAVSDVVEKLDVTDARHSTDKHDD